MTLRIVLSSLATGSALVFGLWLLFRLLPRISPDIRAWSWRLLLLKLAISAFAIGQISLHLLPAANRVPLRKPHLTASNAFGIAIAPAAREIPTPLLGEDRRPSPLQPAPAVNRRSSQPPSVPFESFVLAFWALGMTFFVAQALLATIRTRRALQDAVPVADPEVNALLKTLLDSSRLSRAPRVVWLAAAVSPMVFGIYRPIIVLPRRLASGPREELEMALGHEVSHIRRYDLAWATIAWVVRTVLFFNPAVWLADMELRATQESAIDQEAVWLTGASVLAYGEMLLRAMRPETIAGRPTGLAMFDSFRNAHRRLRAMKHFSKRPCATRPMTVATVVAIGMVCLPTYLLVPANAASPLPLHPNERTEFPSPESGAGHAKVAQGPADSKSRGSAGRKETVAKKAKEPRLASSSPVRQASKPRVEMAVPDRRVAAKATRPEPEPNIRFMNEPLWANPNNGPVSPELAEASKKARDEFNAQVDRLIQTQDARIADYRRGADQREREAQQRESEGQQRKREGIQRARAALLREQVIDEREKDNYQVAPPGQREADARTREADGRQKEADRYQGVLDQRQRETDRWQREFDNNSIATIGKETRDAIALARAKYQKRVAELVASDLSRRREAANALAYAQAQERNQAGSGLHRVRTATGLSFDVPDGYEVVGVRTIGKDSYSVVLRHKKT